MKPKKHFTYQSKHQVWRILISDTDKLIIETRDTSARQVFYSCYNLYTRKIIFESYQPEEKFWIGIETIYRDIIFFHKFTKPDMPGHKQIIAFDINTKSVLWENDNYSFSFVYNGNVFCYQDGFIGRNYLSLNFLTGDIVKDFGVETAEITTLRNKAESEKSYAHYLFPNKFTPSEINDNISEIINNSISNKNIVGDVEYNVYQNLLLFNYHSKALNSIINKFFAFDMDKKKLILAEILNSNLNSFIPDSFFIYKEYLIILKERNCVLIFRLE